MVLNDVNLEKKFLCLCYEHKRISFNLKPDDFYSTDNEKIYKAFMDGFFDLSIESDASKYGVDSGAFYACLETSEFSLSNIKHYEEKLSNLATRRRKIAEYETYIKQMKDPSFEVVSDSIPVSENKASMKEEILHQWKTKERIKFGQFYALTDKIHTFNPGHVMLLAGTSGTGKTNVAIQICEDISDCNDEEWLFLSREMSKADVMERCAKIRFYQNNPDGTRYESNMFFNQNKDNPSFYDAIAPVHMNISDKTGLTIDQEKAIVKYEVAKNPKIKTVVIDYAQLIRGRGSIFERLTYISEVCPLIAKECGVRVILLCQLTKDSYDNQRPTPAHIKGSGALYDNADMVMCLYKDNSVQDNKVMEWLHWKDRPNGSNGKTEFVQNGLYISS
jgi:replicative DNA helicase